MNIKPITPDEIGADPLHAAAREQAIRWACGEPLTFDQWELIYCAARGMIMIETEEVEL